MHQCPPKLLRGAKSGILYEQVQARLLVPRSLAKRFLPSVKAGRWGVETPLSKLGHRNSEAGWHARMSSRFAGKGACACAE